LPIPPHELAMPVMLNVLNAVVQASVRPAQAVIVSLAVLNASAQLATSNRQFPFSINRSATQLVPRIFMATVLRMCVIPAIQVVSFAQRLSIVLARRAIQATSCTAQLVVQRRPIVQQVFTATLARKFALFALVRAVPAAAALLIAPPVSMAGLLTAVRWRVWLAPTNTVLIVMAIRLLAVSAMCAK
jgi:hypothetical protein